MDLSSASLTWVTRVSRCRRDTGWRRHYKVQKGSTACVSSSDAAIHWTGRGSQGLGRRLGSLIFSLGTQTPPGEEVRNGGPWSHMPYSSLEEQQELLTSEASLQTFKTTSQSIYFYYFCIFMCMGVLPVYMYAHACLVNVDTRRGHWTSWSWKYGGLSVAL